jgi:hypothetical protein
LEQIYTLSYNKLSKIYNHLEKTKKVHKGS